MTVADVDVRQIPHKRVILREPDTGWSARSYGRELEEYAAEFGRAPQTATMHPETAAALGLHDDMTDAVDASNSTFLVTSPEYTRQEITLYY